MRKPKRFWVTSNGKARRGWIVASVFVDKNGNEFNGPKQEGIATKKEAKRIAANLNQEVQNSKDSENEGELETSHMENTMNANAKPKEFRRMWINQPSCLQPLHRLHGKNVYAVLEYGSTYRIYTLAGCVTSMQADRLCLSEGWKD